MSDTIYPPHIIQELERLSMEAADHRELAEMSRAMADQADAEADLYREKVDDALDRAEEYRADACKHDDAADALIVAQVELIAEWERSRTTIN